MEKSLWEILVPTHLISASDNPVLHYTSKKISKNYHLMWDNFINQFSPGMTILKTAKGKWINPYNKRMVAENMIPVRLICTEEDIQKIAEFTGKHYGQLEVMYYKISDKVVFHKTNLTYMSPLLYDFNLDYFIFILVLIISQQWFQHFAVPMNIHRNIKPEHTTLQYQIVI